MKTQTKEKLELKHLAPYLPYDLMVRTSEGAVKLMGFNIMQGRLVPQLDYDGEDLGIDEPIKPILRPLSDLTKEIKGFSLTDLITHGAHHIFWRIDFFSIEHLYYHDFKILLSHHFDVFGLIEKGLAISYNDMDN